MKYLLLALSIFYISCSHAPKDIADNYAAKGYMNTEFRYKGQTYLGILPINLTSDSLKDSINYVGIGQGTTEISSTECALNYTKRFTTSTELKISDFVSEVKPCVIFLNSLTDQYKKLEHNITEIGVIYLSILPKGHKAATIGYSERGDLGVKEVVTSQSIAIQRPANTSETVFISTTSTSGTMVITNSCGEPTTYKEYNSQATLISFDEIYKTKKQTCLFNFILLPNDEIKPYFATMFVNIYANDVVPLEHIPYTLSGGNIRLNPASYIWAASINDKLSKDKYVADKEYIIRGLTSNGRKSVYAIKNNKILWW